jgi:hypothetical protein
LVVPLPVPPWDVCERVVEPLEGDALAGLGAWVVGLCCAVRWAQLRGAGAWAGAELDAGACAEGVPPRAVVWRWVLAEDGCTDAGPGAL